MAELVFRFEDAVVEGNTLEVAVFPETGHAVFHITQHTHCALSITQLEIMVRALQETMRATEARSKGESYTYTL